MEGLRYKEVAEKLDVSITTVKTLLVNALKKLRANSTGIDTTLLLLLVKNRK